MRTSSSSTPNCSRALFCTVRSDAGMSSHIAPPPVDEKSRVLFRNLCRADALDTRQDGLLDGWPANQPRDAKVEPADEMKRLFVARLRCAKSFILSRIAAESPFCSCMVRTAPSSRMLAEHARAVSQAVLIALDVQMLPSPSANSISCTGHHAVYTPHSCKPAAPAGMPPTSAQSRPGAVRGLDNLAERRARLGGVVSRLRGLIRLGCANSRRGCPHRPPAHVGPLPRRQGSNIALSRHGEVPRSVPLRSVTPLNRSAGSPMAKRGMAAHEFVFCNIHFRCARSAAIT